MDIIKKDDECKTIEKRRNAEHSFDSSQFLAIKEAENKGGVLYQSLKSEGLIFERK